MTCLSSQTPSQLPPHAENCTYVQIQSMANYIEEIGIKASCIQVLCHGLLILITENKSDSTSQSSQDQMGINFVCLPDPRKNYTYI